MAMQATVLAQIARAASARQEALTDAQLLQQFVDNNDQDAFGIVITRHSAMVLAVCKRVLHIQQDAEDACQAVFVVLAKKARSVCWHASVANWLFTTARQVAHNARLASIRRGKREAAAAVPVAIPAIDPLLNRELLAVLDEELDRLPSRYREPLVLCYLEGLTRDEAAARLGVPVATLKGQLERGRKKLARALTARGCDLGILLILTAASSSAKAFASPFSQSIQTALAGVPSPAVASLVRGVSMNGLLKSSILGFAALVMTIGVGLSWNRTGHVQGQTQDNGSTPAVANREKTKTPDVDLPVVEKVKLLVLGADGKPVAGATIRRLASSRSESNVETVLGKTDAQGRFEAEVTPHCTFTAVADSGGTAWSGSVTNSSELTLKIAPPLPIKGRLVDLQGKPIPNAKVQVVSVADPQNGDLTASYNAYRVNPVWTWDSQTAHLEGTAMGAPKDTITDSDGRFELNGVGLHRIVSLRFDKEGIESARVVVFADPEYSKRMKPPNDLEKKMAGMSGHFRAMTYGPEFTHAVRPDHVITGKVTDSVSGKPVAGVIVAGTATDLDRFFVGSPWHDKVQTTTDKDGKFRLGGLIKKDKRSLHVMGNNTAPYLDCLIDVKDTVGYDPTVIDVQLLPAVVIEGQLVNKATGKPVRGEATWRPFLRPPQEKSLPGGEFYDNFSVTRPSGSHAFTGADGRFQLRIPRAPGVILARADQSDPTAAFTPTYVRDEDRKYLRKEEKDPNIRTTGLRQRDDEEYFNNFLISPIRWENGYAVVIPAAETTVVPVKIGFDPGAKVTLNVTDPNGKPLSGVTLVGPGVYGFSPPTFARPEITLGGIDPKGRPVQLYLFHRERLLCAELQLHGNEAGPVTVHMRPCGTVTGRVLDHEGKPVPDARVCFQLNDAVANDLVGQKLFRTTSEVTTDAAGKFSVPYLFPDQEFILLARLPGLRNWMSALQRSQLKPGETKDLGDIRFLDPKTLKGE